MAVGSSKENDAKEDIHHFSSGENVARPKKATDYREKYMRHTETPIVIDNGSYRCRVGWAGEEEPRYDFRNLLAKPRVKATGQVASIVGDYSAASVSRHFDFARSSVRSPFDGNVVYNYETLESIFDYAFDRLGLEGDGRVAHSLLVTECPGNPLYSRAKMAELAFETYGVPSLALGVDAPFSFAHNLKKGRCGPDGLLVSVGHSATHVIPMVGGEPVWEACCRAPLGGLHCTDFLKKYLSLVYPHHAASLSWERVEEMKHKHCHRGGKEAEARSRLWQLPFVAPLEPVVAALSEEEIARKAAVKERAAQRLRDMAAAKRAAKAAELEVTLQGLEELQRQVAGLEDDSEATQALSGAGLSSAQELQAQVVKTSMALRKARGEDVDEEEERAAEAAAAAAADVPDSVKYPLLAIDDKDLAPEQIKEKRRQRLLKNGAEGRARAKQRKDDEKSRLEQERVAEEAKRAADPEGYLEELRARHAGLLEKCESRKRRKLGAAGASTPAWLGGAGGASPGAAAGRAGAGTGAGGAEGGAAGGGASGGGGSGGGMDEAIVNGWLFFRYLVRQPKSRLRSASYRDSKRLITGGRGGCPEGAGYVGLVTVGGFGWWYMLYQEGPKMAWSQLEIDPSFVPPGGGGGAGGAGGATDLPGQLAPPRLTERDFQIRLGVERVRAAEILFEPSIIAVDQAGLGELLVAALRRTPDELKSRVRNGGIFLTGGGSMVSGIEARVREEAQKTRPLGQNIEIVRAYDPSLDAWHGASELAASRRFQKHAFSKEEYEERGSDWLRRYSISYT
eukprot:jgi/Mesen1/3524/ME000197S02546